MPPSIPVSGVVTPRDAAGTATGSAGSRQGATSVPCLSFPARPPAAALRCHSLGGDLSHVHSTARISAEGCKSKLNASSPCLLGRADGDELWQQSPSCREGRAGSRSGASRFHPWPGREDPGGRTHGLGPLFSQAEKFLLAFLHRPQPSWGGRQPEGWSEVPGWGEERGQLPQGFHGIFPCVRPAPARASTAPEPSSPLPWQGLA